ncbi:MAG: protein kinase [Kofleriaceae bacterium]|nr:protein kinase [Kofleriaceae bacterium]
MTAQPGTASGSSAQLRAGAQLGDYVLGQPLWPLRIADAYRANGPKGPATVYVIKAAVAGDPAVRDQVIAGTRAAAVLPEHKHLVRTLAAGLTGDILWIATEEVDGSLVRDMLLKKKQAGSSGLGARGTGNLITGVTAALADVVHGALASESVVVNRQGRIRVTDLALGPGTLAAMKAGIIPMQSCIAPEVQASGEPTSVGDVYSVGALLYESLVGSALERGGPRPSEVVSGMNAQIDELVARACHRDADKRFGRVDVLGEVVGEALGKGGAMETSAVPKLEHAPELGSQVQSLATELSASTSNPAVSGNLVVDRALQAALADSTEKWLISKGRLDYGPFSLADVVAQIEKGEIVAGNIIMDKDTGARSDVGGHPLLGPMVDAAKARLDDQRRAQAEVRVQSAEKKRGAMLYAVIGLGALGAAAGVYFIIQSVRSDDKAKEVNAVAKLEGADLKVSVSLPKVPPAKKRSGGSRGTAGAGGAGRYDDNLALDLSDDSDETETLGMDKVFAVYSSYGGQLGSCLGANGVRSANIGMIIDGPSGRVKGVKVNGQSSGGLHGCIWRVMTKMQFPKINGPRTRAEFDIGV